MLGSNNRVELLYLRHSWPETSGLSAETDNTELLGLIFNVFAVFPNNEEDCSLSVSSLLLLTLLTVSLYFLFYLIEDEKRGDESRGGRAEV